MNHSQYNIIIKSIKMGCNSDLDANEHEKVGKECICEVKN